MLRLFERVDAIIAPATPTTAPLIGQKTFVLDGEEMLVRPNIGIYTQPISFIGLPVVAVPVPGAGMPIGVQVIAAPWREDIALRIAAALERSGVARAPPAGAVTMEINHPEALAELEAAFQRYEAALVSNDVATLDALFAPGPHTIRYGIGENLVRRRRDPRVSPGAAFGRPGPDAWIGRCSPPTAAISAPPPPCSIARARRARSAGRCRAGCGFPRAGGWWRRM